GAVGSIVDAVVALLGGGQLAVTTIAFACARPRDEAIEGEPVVGGTLLALGLEDRDLVDVAVAEAPRLGRVFVDGERVLQALVEATQVERQVPVDVDEDVVVTAEGKRRNDVLVVLEPVPDFAREVE